MFAWCVQFIAKASLSFVMDFSLKMKKKECGKQFKGYYEEKLLMVNEKYGDYEKG